MVHSRDSTIANSGDVVVHFLKMQAVEIRNVSRRMKREYLPSPVWPELGAIDISFNDQATARRNLSIGNNLRAFGRRREMNRYGMQRGSVAGGKIAYRLKPPGKWVNVTGHKLLSEFREQLLRRLPVASRSNE